VNENLTMKKYRKPSDGSGGVEQVVFSPWHLADSRALRPYQALVGYHLQAADVMTFLSSN
jgi:hypothetical protein